MERGPVDRPPAVPDVVTRLGVLPTSRRPVVMGVLNVTPDSFSDGGRYLDVEAAVAAGRRMADEGADIIDVGGESTRPGAEPVPAEVELERVIPVVRGLAAEGRCVSIDTVKARVAAAAVAAGAAIVNDVSSALLDPEMPAVVGSLGVPYVLTHLQGTPRTMQDDPHYDDVVTEVVDHLGARIEVLVAAGLAEERIVLDPGIGFGKRLEHNLALLARLDRLVALGRPVLVGVSRKRFIGAITGVVAPSERLAGSLAAASVAVANGARIVRAHDVAATVQAVQVAWAIASAGDLPAGSGGPAPGSGGAAPGPTTRP
ncbi:MAG: dihydropteroate synthase [Nitriliruptoraceae bacterium]